MSDTLYLDTEFNGFGGELISLALVPGNPSLIPWYEAVRFEAKPNPWVVEHVLPKLDRKPENPKMFRKCFHAYLNGFSNPEIICDWHADAEHFCRLLAGDDYGSSLDYACRLTILKTPPGQPVSANPHNALADAAALMRWHQSLRYAA